jgi:primosomal protein N'
MRSFTNIIWDNYEWILLYSLDTQNKKDTNWWKIKTWNEQLIYTTSSEIFQDFKNLKNIYLLEPQKWYYAAQQDPRYKVEIVLEKIAELNQANIKIINSEEIF